MVKSATSFLTVALSIVLTSGCGVSVRITPFAPGKYAPRPDDHPIQMFSTKAPECPYEELGLIRAEPKDGLTRWERVVNGLLTHARRLGGDAVLLRQSVELRGSSENVVIDDDVLAGTVIRFERTECQR